VSLLRATSASFGYAPNGRAGSDNPGVTGALFTL